MEIARQTLLLVERDAADVLCVDSRRYVVWDYRATAARAHDRNQHISGMHGVPFKLTIFFWCNEPVLPPPKLIGDCVVDAEDSDALINELAMQQLTTERAGAN